MTDDRRAQASVTAQSGAFYNGDPYTLAIACDDGSTQLTVTWLWQLGPERLIDVDTRVEDGKVTREPWFNDGQATRYGGAESTFIESLFGETGLAHSVDVPDDARPPRRLRYHRNRERRSQRARTCGW